MTMEIFKPYPCRSYSLIIVEGKIQKNVERYITEHGFLDYAVKHWPTHF